MIERIYKFLNQEKGDRVCTGVTPEACRWAPHNYFLLIAVNILTKVGDVLSAPKTVITWLMGYLGAPIFLMSLLVPIRESGSMVPQIFMSHLLRRVEFRKWWWIIGSIIQAVSLFLIVFVAHISLGYIAGFWIVVLVAVFSLGRSICSLVAKDIVGKTIPKTRRGKLNGYSSSLSGILVLVSGLFLLLNPLEGARIEVLLWLVGIAGILWIISAIVYGLIVEFKSDVVAPNSDNQFQFFTVLRSDQTLQKFILARALLISSALMSPFIVILSQQNIGSNIYILGLFILAGGIASIVSGPFWGYLADNSSKKVLVIGASIVAVLGLLLLLTIGLNLSIISSVWLYPVIFFVLGVAHDGIRLGRKTYIVDIAEGQQRTQYVAISNTAIGILLLIVGGFTAWLGNLSLIVAISTLTLMVVLGIWFSWKLPEALKK